MLDTVKLTIQNYAQKPGTTHLRDLKIIDEQSLDGRSSTPVKDNTFGFERREFQPSIL